MKLPLFAPALFLSCSRLLPLLLSWQSFCTLTAEERSITDWLSSIGHSEHIAQEDTIAFDSHMRVQNLDMLIQYTYPHIDDTVPPQYFIDRIKLAPRHTAVDNVNIAVLFKQDARNRGHSRWGTFPTFPPFVSPLSCSNSPPYIRQHAEP